MARDTRSSPARWLAVAALVAAGGLVGAVTVATLGGETPAPTATVKTAPAAGSKQPSRTFHVVRDGDVLSVIAERYGVAVDRLEELNPEIDPRALRPGTRLRLRR
jgi:LysM repeat protein